MSCYCVYITHYIFYYLLDFVLDFIRNQHTLSKSDQKTVLDFHWILHWIIGGFSLNIKSGRFYAKFTRFPYNWIDPAFPKR